MFVDTVAVISAIIIGGGGSGNHYFFKTSFDNNGQDSKFLHWNDLGTKDLLVSVS